MHCQDSATGARRPAAWRRGILGLGVACLLAAAGGRAHATDPQLRVEGGMHTAPIKAIATDAAGRFAVTASLDKTARVWDLASGRLLHVLRPPLGAGNEGKLQAVALSPDGATVAVGGWLTAGQSNRSSIYLFDRASGRLTAQIGGVPNVTTRLAISPDGRFLAAGMAGANGVGVWPLAAPQQAPWSDTAYGDDTYGVAWSADGRLATTSFDGQVRLYNLDAAPGGRGLQRLAAVAAPGGRKPYGIAFRPTGDELAVAYFDSPRVDLLDAATLALRATPGSAGITNGSLASVAWTADGQSLLAGGKWSLDDGRNTIRRWPAQGRGAPVDVPTVGNTITDLAPLPDGRVLVAAFTPAWGLLDPAGGDTQAWQPRGQPPGADLRGNLKGFAVSADGQHLRFGFEAAGHAPYRFDLPGRQLRADADAGPGTPAGAPALAPARTDGLDVQDWDGTFHPRLGATALTLKDSERARSLAVAPDAAGFVLGTEFSLRAYDARGALRWQQDAPGVVWSVAIPAETQLVVAAYADGTIRWHRLSDGAELLAFFPHADRKRWVLWTPSGYYDASPGGEDLIGWHVNNGPAHEADFFPAGRFRARFHRPDVIDHVLDTLDEGQALARANAAVADQGSTESPGTGTEAVASVRRARPPVVDLLGDDALRASSPRVAVRVRARTDKDAPVTGWQVRVNGQLQPDARGLVREKPAPAPASTDADSPGATGPGADDAATRTLSVEVPPQDSTIEVFARNRNGVSTPATVRVAWAAPTPSAALPPPAPPGAGVATVAGAEAATLPAGTPAPGVDLSLAPRLYVLAVGVSRYKDPEINSLGLPAKDARDFAATLQHQQGRLYRTVEVRLLTDQQATADAIGDGLDWLQGQVTQHDVGMIFLAGHGLNDPTHGYVFLPHDADPDRLRRTGVPMDEFRKTLAALTGKAVFFLDTCHSGNVLGGARVSREAFSDISGVVNEISAAENGVVVFSSSTGRQLSFEDPAWGNGAFTKALVEGLDGKADPGRRGRVTFKMLDYYVSERVKELTSGKQSPVTQAPGGVPDFPLAVVPLP